MKTVLTTPELDRGRPDYGEAQQGKLWSWASRGILAQIDQAVVSGTNFLAMVMVGRAAGPSELGVYSLGLTILLITMATQESLISTPYLLRGVNLSTRRRSVYAASSLIMSILLGFAVAVPMALIGIIGRSRPNTNLDQATLALAIVISFFLIRIFWRRYELAHERTGMALTLDGIVTLCQLSLLAMLATRGELTAVTGLGALGVACVIASGSWALIRRRELLFSRAHLIEDARHSWRLGMWILASHVTMMLSIQAVQWVLLLVLDEAATGLFVAPLTMVMIINPFLMGVTNVFLPASASAFASGRSSEVRSSVHLLALLLVPLMAAFLGLVILFGPELMPMIYGAEYAGHDLTLILLAVTVVLRTFGIPANIGLWVFERTRENFFCGAMGFIVTMVVTLTAVPTLGIVGAAIGLVIGDAVTSSLRWWRWRRSKGDGASTDTVRSVFDET